MAKRLLDSPQGSRGMRLQRPDANLRAYIRLLHSDPPPFCKLAQVMSERQRPNEAVAYALEFWDALVNVRVPLLYRGSVMHRAFTLVSYEVYHPRAAGLPTWLAVEMAAVSHWLGPFIDFCSMGWMIPIHEGATVCVR